MIDAPAKWRRQPALPSIALCNTECISSITLSSRVLCLLVIGMRELNLAEALQFAGKGLISASNS
ncbi:MAG: hypothetical protein BGP09_04585 [Rhizobium sp. 60-20]|nr:MAG: hypothetical protein BGP09_04585 [Rhizobium sp. 60-20]